MRGRALVSVALLLAGVLPAGAAVAAPPTSDVGNGQISVLGAGVPHGVKPNLAQYRKPGTSAGPLVLHSNVAVGAVSHTPTVYLVFWGSQWANDPYGAAPALQAFFSALGTTGDNWSTIMTQYCSNTLSNITDCTQGTAAYIGLPHSALAGVWFDSATASSGKPTSGQLAAEAAAAALHFGNSTQSSNSDAQYVIASASGVRPQGFGTSYCAWHSSASTTAGTIAYTNLPYIPDLGAGACTTLKGGSMLDGYFSTETHEYAESLTDLWPSLGWLTQKGAEIGDLCVSSDAHLTLAGNTYDVQGLWSNLANVCVTSRP